MAFSHALIRQPRNVSPEFGVACQEWKKRSYSAEEAEH